MKLVESVWRESSVRVNRSSDVKSSNTTWLLYPMISRHSLDWRRLLALFNASVLAQKQNYEFQ